MSTEPTNAWVLIKPEWDSLAIPVELFAQFAKHIRRVTSKYEETGMTYSVNTKPMEMLLLSADVMTALDVKARLLPEPKG